MMFGVFPIDEKVEEQIELSSERKMHWNGKSFETIVTPTQTKEEVLSELIDRGYVVDGDKIWISRELFNKHLEFVDASNMSEGR